MGGGVAVGAFRKGASSLLERYHSDSLMAPGPVRFSFFLKWGGGWGEFDERREIQFSDSSANSSDLVLVFKQPCTRSVEVTWRAPGGEVMSLRSRCQRPAHIFALRDNKPIVLPDKASV